MVTVGNHYHLYGSLCCVVTICAALYLYCGVAVMFLVLGWVFGVTVSKGVGQRYFRGWWCFSKTSKILLGDILCSSFK